MSNSPRVEMPYLLEGQSNGEQYHNDALNTVEVFLNFSVINAWLDTPPESPTNGQRWHIGDSPTGVWAAHAGKIVYYYDGYYYLAPLEGMRMWVEDIDSYYTYDGSNWIPFWAGTWHQIETYHFTATPLYKDTAGAAVDDWVADTATNVGDWVKPTSGNLNGYIYECVATAGDTKTHVDTEPAWGTTAGADIVDDQVTWRCRKPNVLTMTTDLTGYLRAGMGLKYKYSAGTRYGIILSISASQMLVGGDCFLGNADVTEFRVCRVSNVHTKEIHIGGAYGNGVQAGLFLSDEGKKMYFGSGSAYIVDMLHIHKTNDTGAEAKINLTIGGAVQLNEDTNNGVQSSTSLQSVPPSSLSNAGITRTSAIDVNCVVQGGTGDGADLTLILVFVPY